jgi:hypothetical protein
MLRSFRVTIQAERIEICTLIVARSVCVFRCLHKPWSADLQVAPEGAY